MRAAYLYLALVIAAPTATAAPAIVDVIYWDRTCGNYAIETGPDGSATVTIVIGGHIVLRNLSETQAVAYARANGVAP